MNKRKFFTIPRDFYKKFVFCVNETIWEDYKKDFLGKYNAEVLNQYQFQYSGSDERVLWPVLEKATNTMLKKE